MKDLSEILSERELGRALRHGAQGKCPRCGSGKLFNGYLQVRDSCDFCEQEFSHHRADDGPSWLTMLIVGHIVGPLLLLTHQVVDLPSWVHAVIWPSMAMVLIILLLPRVKGGIIAFQWVKRMHGFDD